MALVIEKSKIYTKTWWKHRENSYNHFFYFSINYNSNPSLHYVYPPVNSAILTNIAHTLACVPRFYVQVRCPRSKDCASCLHHRLHFAGLDFQEKPLVPVGPWVFKFSCQQEYFMWSLYEIIHICTAVVHESEMWSSQ